MDMLFCLKWSLRKKNPLSIISEKEAENRHKSKKTYSVVVRENKKILYVIEVVKNCVIVWFMNELVNPYLIYDFQLKENNRIFLKGAIYNEYAHDRKTKSTIYNFYENGYTVMEKHNLIENTVEERDGTYDVTCNWDLYPVFGDYSSLLRAERENLD